MALDGEDLQPRGRMTWPVGYRLELNLSRSVQSDPKWEWSLLQEDCPGLYFYTLPFPCRTSVKRAVTARLNNPNGCSICVARGIDRSTVYPTAYSLKRHRFSTHLHEKGFVLKCGIDGCPVELPTRRALSSHVSRAHPGCEWSPFVSLNVTTLSADHDRHTVQHRENEADICMQGHRLQFETNITDGEESSPTSCETNSPMQCNPHVPVPEEILEDDDDVCVFKQEKERNNNQRRINTALSLIQLKANYNLTQVALEAVQLWTEEQLAHTTQTLIGGVKCVNAQESGTLTYRDVFDLGEGLANPFQELKSEWMLKKLLRDQLDYVEPETVVLLECVDDGIPGGRKNHTMQYVPMTKVLKLLYKDKSFREQLGKRLPSTSGEMRDFLDGNYCRNHPLFATNPSALQLQLYFDGFEVANPLGSKIQKHNIGALYFSILNLDPVYRSTLKSICLVGLLFENDVKHPEIGWEIILRRFNSDLKTLEDGFHILVDGEEHFVQGSIAQCSLDNKAAHSLFGLQESFYGERSCISRYCLCTSTNIQTKTSARDCALRDRQSFDQDLETLERTGQVTKGVKTRCFIESRYFHRGDAYAADIHHDVLEGLVPGMLKPILQELVVKKTLVSTGVLNGRIANFDYNPHDMRNKPSVITDAKLKDDSRNLKQYAAQCWCLLRKMPLFLGDRVPSGDEHWLLLLQLVDVVDLIMSPKVDSGTLSFLDMQLSVLFAEFRRLFPNIRVTPKMHYTLHYPRLMKEVGPLIRHWVMRYEAKHHFFKRAATITGNYINVPHTLAVRHQMLQVVHVHQGGLLNTDVVIEEGHPMNVCDLPHAGDISSLLHVTRVTVCRKVTVHGTQYSVGCALLAGFDKDGFIELGEVTDILVSASKTVCFVLNMFEVVEYSEHFHSWRIERPSSSTIRVVLCDALHDHQPVGVHYSFGNDSALYANFKWNVRNLKDF